MQLAERVAKCGADVHAHGVASFPFPSATTIVDHVHGDRWSCRFGRPVSVDEPVVVIALGNGNDAVIVGAPARALPVGC